MPELTFNAVDRDTLTRDLDGVRVTELMRHEAASDHGRGGRGDRGRLDA
jgi:hypothetical protein